jgi:hypothetical protein
MAVRRDPEVTALFPTRGVRWLMSGVLLSLGGCTTPLQPLTCSEPSGRGTCAGLEGPIKFCEYEPLDHASCAGSGVAEHGRLCVAFRATALGNSSRVGRHFPCPSLRDVEIAPGECRIERLSFVASGHSCPDGVPIFAER